MWTPTQRITKRILDLTAAIALFVLLSWLLLVAWVIAAIETRSSGLFVQERIGLRGRPFRLVKIRTMRRWRGLDGSVTTARDPRVTLFGRLFRALKIDELPQLVNVLSGTMSLVGPRPTVEEDVARMSEEQKRRHLVRPGLTGLAQVSGNTALSWPERIEFDLLYVDRGNLRMDFEILLRTLRLFVAGRIETHPPGPDEWTR